MPRALALLVIFLAAGLSARGQAPALRQSATPGPDQNEALARQAISNLRLLESEVIVYKSLAAFEEGRALGRVSSRFSKRSAKGLGRGRNDSRALARKQIKD